MVITSAKSINPSSVRTGLNGRFSPLRQDARILRAFHGDKGHALSFPSRKGCGCWRESQYEKKPILEEEVSP